MISSPLKGHYVGSLTIRVQGSLLCVTGRSGGPGGSVSSLGSSTQFGEGQRLAVVHQRVLLQLADGHRGEGARQALVCVLLTWRETEKCKSLYKNHCDNEPIQHHKESHSPRSQSATNMSLSAPHSLISLILTEEISSCNVYFHCLEVSHIHIILSAIPQHALPL